MPETPSLRELQHRIIDYLQGGDGNVRELVAEQPPVSIEARLQIYASAYGIRLREALETDHEMLNWYLGDEQFEALGNAYISRFPSKVVSLRYFGNALPKFLRKEPPYANAPELAELAAFERLMLDVFDAAGADRVQPAELAQLPPERWPDMRLRFHPSVQIFAAKTNAIPIWQALKEEQTPPEATVSDEPDHWLLWRSTDRLSMFRPLSIAEHGLLVAAIGGADFSTLCESLLEWQTLSQQQISEAVLKYLLDWLDQGIIRKLDLPAH